MRFFFVLYRKLKLAIQLNLSIPLKNGIDLIYRLFMPKTELILLKTRKAYRKPKLSTYFRN